jgi:RimJ/RimL family protein N-acetyltransferase
MPGQRLPRRHGDRPALALVLLTTVAVGKAGHCEFPVTIVQTGQVEPLTIPAGRLVLRPFTLADVPWVYDVSMDSALQQYVELPMPYELEHAEYFVREIAIGGWGTGQRAEFLVEDAGTATRLGRVGLGLARAGLAEIGYWVDPKTRTRGVATEAVRAACHWGFHGLGLQLIEWRAEVGNLASRRVAEKAGFLIEATLRRRLLHRGVRVDAWVGSLLAGEVEQPR